jgi:hypothetical protein
MLPGESEALSVAGSQLINESAAGKSDKRISNAGFSKPISVRKSTEIPAQPVYWFRRTMDFLGGRACARNPSISPDA